MVLIVLHWYRSSLISSGKGGTSFSDKCRWNSLCSSAMQTQPAVLYHCDRCSKSTAMTKTSLPLVNMMKMDIQLALSSDSPEYLSECWSYY